MEDNESTKENKGITWQRRKKREDKIDGRRDKQKRKEKSVMMENERMEAERRGNTERK